MSETWHALNSAAEARAALAPFVTYFAHSSRARKDFGQVADDYPMWGMDDGSGRGVWVTAGDVRRAGRLLYGPDWNTCQEFLVGEWACEFLRARLAEERS